MKPTYLVLAPLAIVWLVVIPSGEGNPLHSQCHSSIVLPLDPLVAVKAAERAVRSSPLSSEAHRELGSAYLSMFDKSEAAQQEFREVVRLDPTAPVGYSGLGWSYLDLNSAATSVQLNTQRSNSDIKRYGVALGMFELALGLDPNDASAHLGRAQAFSLLGRDEDAETPCRAALASCQNSAEAWDLLGNVLVNLGRYGEAIDAYKAEIKIATAEGPLESLSPSYSRGRLDVAVIYRLVGDILFTLQRTEEAIESYEKALATSGDTSSLHHRLALANYQTGDNKNYVSHLETLRVNCSTTQNEGDWCHYYEDLVGRLSDYRSNPGMLLRVTNLNAIPTMR